MVCKRIETRTGTSQIFGARSLPYVVAGDVNMLILVESCKRETPRTSLSLFIPCVLRYGILFL